MLKWKKIISNILINSVIFKILHYVSLESLKLPFFQCLNSMWQSLDPSQCKCVGSG